MKRFLIAMLAVIAVAAMAAQSFAGVELKYGGLFRFRVVDSNNMDGVATDSVFTSPLAPHSVWTGDTATIVNGALTPPSPYNSAGVTALANGNKGTGAGGTSGGGGLINTYMGIPILNGLTSKGSYQNISTSASNNTPASAASSLTYTQGGNVGHNFNDSSMYLDERLRMYFTFVASERLQLVTKWETNSEYGYNTYIETASGSTNPTAGNLYVGGGRFGGGQVGADAVNFQLKNVYLDFLLPSTPTRVKVGIAGLTLMKGWVLDDDVATVSFDTKFAPVTIKMGYVGAALTNAVNWNGRLDDFYLGADVAMGPFSGGVLGFIQDGRAYDMRNFLSADHAAIWQSPTSASQATAVYQINSANLFNVPNLDYMINAFDTMISWQRYLGKDALAYNGVSRLPNMIALANYLSGGTTNNINLVTPLYYQVTGVPSIGNTLRGLPIDPVFTANNPNPAGVINNVSSKVYSTQVGTALVQTTNQGTIGIASNNNTLVDVGMSVGYKTDWIDAYVNYIHNFGHMDLTYTPGTYATLAAFNQQLGGNGIPPRTINFEGWMVEAGASFTFNPVTFTLGGFAVSGGNMMNVQKWGDNFYYPRGASHYWSEVMGLGTLDSQFGAVANDRPIGQYGYQGADIPSNLWTLSTGVAVQALPGTKLTLNYYYIGTMAPSVSDFTTGYAANTIKYSREVGNEFDFYLDQDIVDGLKARLVMGYLFAGPAFSMFPGETNAYKCGAQLLWTF